MAACQGYDKVDNAAVLPVGIHLRIFVSSDDVLHSFAVPSLGIKVDAHPGRINMQATTMAARGFYIGQCSELCGIAHGLMPINILGVEESEFSA